MQNPDDQYNLCDWIGEESAIDLRPDVTVEVYGGPARSNRRRRRVAEAEKEYPPAMYVTWVMKKYCTDDGRVIIREEKTKRRDYFEAYRLNGRLVLKIFPFGDEEIDGQDEEARDDQAVEDTNCVYV